MTTELTMEEIVRLEASLDPKRKSAALSEDIRSRLKNIQNKANQAIFNLLRPRGKDYKPRLSFHEANDMFNAVLSLMEFLHEEAKKQ